MNIIFVIGVLLVFQTFQSAETNNSTDSSNNTTQSAWDQFHTWLNLICTIFSLWETIKGILSSWW
uniref:MEG n=1 Tax=Schistosoma mansoni TaxID=6183 RepID=A0A5K4F704_SCHMA